MGYAVSDSAVFNATLQLRGGGQLRGSQTSGKIFASTNPLSKPAVTSPAAEHYRPLAGTKLYCLVTEAHVCKQLARGCTRQRGGRDLNPRPIIFLC